MSRRSEKPRRDLYQAITDKIVCQLEQGVRPWLKPWNTEAMAGRVALPLRHNGVPYRGINVVALWMQVLAKGSAAPRWQPGPYPAYPFGRAGPV